MFPSVSLNFAGDASMVLKPENYLLKQKSVVFHAKDYYMLLSLVKKTKLRLFVDTNENYVLSGR